MAVTISAKDLAIACRVDAGNAVELAQIERLRSYAIQAVTDYARAAPDVIHNEAAVRLVGYLYDQPFATANIGYANALRNSGAAAILQPYTNIGVGLASVDTEVTAGSGGSGGGAFIPQSAFSFKVKPKLNEFRVSTNQNIASSGSGYEATLLAETQFNTPITADNEFFTVFEGFVAIEVANSANITIRLHTKHSFGEGFTKTFDTVKEFQFDLVTGVVVTIPLNVFNSISVVSLGTLTIGGKTITIEQPDLELPSRISYTLEVISATRKTNVRNTNTLKTFNAINPETISYQLQQAVIGTGEPSSSGGSGSELPIRPVSGDFYLELTDSRLIWQSVNNALKRELYSEFVGDNPSANDVLSVDSVDVTNELLNLKLRNDLLTDSQLTTKLADYVETTTLTRDYTSNTGLTTLLANYVLQTKLTNDLGNYATTAALEQALETIGATATPINLSVANRTAGAESQTDLSQTLNKGTYIVELEFNQGDRQNVSIKLTNNDGSVTYADFGIFNGTGVKTVTRIAAITADNTALYLTTQRTGNRDVRLTAISLQIIALTRSQTSADDTVARAGVATNKGLIDTNTAAIATNKSNIATNTADIATADLGIAKNLASIETLDRLTKDLHLHTQPAIWGSGGGKVGIGTAWNNLDNGRGYATTQTKGSGWNTANRSIFVEVANNADLSELRLGYLGETTAEQIYVQGNSWIEQTDTDTSNRHFLIPIYGRTSFAIGTNVETIQVQQVLNIGSVEFDGNLRDNIVTSAAIAANAVTADKIAASAVTAGKIAASAVTAGKIAANAVNTAKVANDAITIDKIADAVVLRLLPTGATKDQILSYTTQPTWITPDSSGGGFKPKLLIVGKTLITAQTSVALNKNAADLKKLTDFFEQTNQRAIMFQLSNESGADDHQAESSTGWIQITGADTGQKIYGLWHNFGFGAIEYWIEVRSNSAKLTRVGSRTPTLNATPKIYTIDYS